MDEVTLYNLHAKAAGAGHAAQSAAERYAEDLMIIHLHLDHKMSLEDLAKRFNREMIDVKRQLYPELVGPELDPYEIERYRKRGRKLVWNVEKQMWKSEPLNKRASSN